MKKVLWLLSMAGSALPAVVSADELAVGLGAGVYEGGIRGLDAESAALPLVHYQGERLGVLFTTVSWQLLEPGPFRLALTGSARFDGYQSSDSPYLAGMQDRGAALDIGLEASLWDFSLALSTDASDTHGGSEITLGYSHGIEVGKLRLQLMPALRWQSSALSDYYFGVANEEAATLLVDGMPWRREAYRPGAAWIPTFSAVATYQLTPRWSLIGGGQAAHLPNRIGDSPIVERRTQWGAFAGLAYHFR